MMNLPNIISGFSQFPLSPRFIKLCL